VTILVVGNGFIGQAVLKALGPERGRMVRHGDLEAPHILQGVETVVFAGRHPRLGRPDWTIEDDQEPPLAKIAARQGVSFITLGTRKVYAPTQLPLMEESRIGPTDLYGQQKLQLERSLHGILGKRLTRLRLANVIGYERAPHRSSFMTSVLGTLASEGEIRFAMSPFVARDFVPVEKVAAWIAHLAERPPGGVLNIGSGVPLPTGQLALWVLQGFGHGRLVIENPGDHDPFVFDIRKLKGLIADAGLTQDQLREYCRDLGRRLSRER